MRNPELPRLRKCLQWQAILSRSEAQGVIDGHRRDGHSFSEAVVHFTEGTAETKGLLNLAIRNRNVVRELRGPLGKEVGLERFNNTTPNQG